MRARRFAQLSVLLPLFDKQYYAFTTRYCAGRHMNGLWIDTGSSCLDELALLLTNSVMIRRAKADVLSQLPDKIRRIVRAPQRVRVRTP